MAERRSRVVRSSRAIRMTRIRSKTSCTVVLSVNRSSNDQVCQVPDLIESLVVGKDWRCVLCAEKFLVVSTEVPGTSKRRGDYQGSCQSRHIYLDSNRSSNEDCGVTDMDV